MDIEDALEKLMSLDGAAEISLQAVKRSGETVLSANVIRREFPTGCDLKQSGKAPFQIAPAFSSIYFLQSPVVKIFFRQIPFSDRILRYLSDHRVFQDGSQRSFSQHSSVLLFSVESDGSL